MLVVVFVELGVARGVVAAIGNFHVAGFMTFAVSLLMSLVIAAGTDYAIFSSGRYHGRATLARTARRRFTPPIGWPTVVLGSGPPLPERCCATAVAAALPYLNTLAISPARSGCSS